MFSLQEDFIERKISFKDVVDSYDFWVTTAKMNRLDKTAVAEDFCKRDLEWTWGKGSRVEFNYDKLELKCHGPNGEFVLLNQKGE